MKKGKKKNKPEIQIVSGERESPMGFVTFLILESSEKEVRMGTMHICDTIHEAKITMESELATVARGTKAVITGKDEADEYTLHGTHDGKKVTWSKVE